jgi:hypothetical protein
LIAVGQNLSGIVYLNRQYDWAIEKFREQLKIFPTLLEAPHTIRAEFDRHRCALHLLSATMG